MRMLAKPLAYFAKRIYQEGAKTLTKRQQQQQAKALAKFCFSTCPIKIIKI